jgi:flagellar hook-associated protein 1 FlgK
MSLMSALSAAVSGLRTTQTGINLVSQNVANADSAGYTRKIIQPVQTLNGAQSSGVKAGAVQRVMDDLLVRQLNTETSGAGYAKTRAEFATSLDRLFGAPGEASSLDDAMNDFTNKLTSLANDPSSFAARQALLASGQTLAGRIGSIANGVQELRSQAEGRIDAAVTRANELLKGIAQVNGQITAENLRGGSAALEDERDRMLNELAGLMDINVQKGQNGSIMVRTPSGQTLFDGINPTTLSFDRRPALDPGMTYDPGNSGVGVIRAETGSGASFDLIAGGAFRSGEIAAALEMRDDILVQAQLQLDEMAAGLARAFSDRPAELNGNTLEFAANEASTAEFTLDGQFYRVSAANLGDLQTELEGGPYNLTVALAGNDMTITSGAGALNLLGGSSTRGVLQVAPPNGADEFPFFVDRGNGNAIFTGVGEQITGFAQRMAVNPDVLSNADRLVRSQTDTPQGDQSRPQAVLDALTNRRQVFSPGSGIGGVAAPVTTTVTDFSRRIVEMQGAATETAKRLDEGQKVALNAIQSRFAETAGVNIDQEMAQLVQLQTAYGANARIMTAVREMMDTLMRI